MNISKFTAAYNSRPKATIAVLALLAALAVAAVYALDARELTAEEVISDVSQLVILPEGEEPSIATIVDLEKLSDQPFFSQAKEGDKILVFSRSRKAILYRPSEKRIVEVGPIIN